ncbi:MAG: LysM peptidoglycan-binding domain-containing protein, partial [Candidatus Obscuribacterales bacterium]|nr:LysM peptidoglycan-binding domain-containing protein [Candidatus Obscuribacterales bacterium]
NDASPGINQFEQVAANDHDDQRNGFFSNLLHEALNGLHTMIVEGRGIALSSSADAGNVVPEMAISDSKVDPYSYGGDTRKQPNADTAPKSNFDPYAYGGDSSPEQNVPPFAPSANNRPQDGQSDVPPPAAPQQTDAPPPNAPPQTDVPPATPTSTDAPPTAPANPNSGDVAPSTPPGSDSPPSAPPKPDSPTPDGDKQIKMGDRMFTVHSDGSAEYKVAKGDCVWFVATDVLKSRNGKAPNDALIAAEVNKIAEASGLTKNGRNPNLIYPGDKLVIPAAEKTENETQS